MAGSMAQMKTMLIAGAHAACGSTITITADGRDEADAIDALASLVTDGFGENACGA